MLLFANRECRFAFNNIFDEFFLQPIGYYYYLFYLLGGGAFLLFNLKGSILAKATTFVRTLSRKRSIEAKPPIQLNPTASCPEFPHSARIDKESTPPKPFITFSAQGRSISQPNMNNDQFVASEKPIPQVREMPSHNLYSSWIQQQDSVSALQALTGTVHLPDSSLWQSHRTSDHDACSVREDNFGTCANLSHENNSQG